jgi:hypothetical protein
LYLLLSLRLSFSRIAKGRALFKFSGRTLSIPWINTLALSAADRRLVAPLTSIALLIRSRCPRHTRTPQAGLSRFTDSHTRTYHPSYIGSMNGCIARRSNVHNFNKARERGQRYGAGSTIIRRSRCADVPSPRSSKLQPDVTKKAWLRHCIREGRYPFSISFLFSPSTSKHVQDD